ncbi:MAG TPA: hypothetical protein VGQ57_06090 [Polyangiaceae bacterium]|jgi:hypothetical protein|nr:hypothetical protein [Polyangiaceae bacterium]
MPTLLVGDGSAVLVGRRARVGADLIGCAVGCGAKVGGLPEVIDGYRSRLVVGAEGLAESSGVWVKTHFKQEGPYLCATVYAVAAGEPRIVELRIDTRPIARALVRSHAALHAEALAKSSLRRGTKVSGTVIGWSIGKLWKGAKKAAKAIGRAKLVKGVVGVTKKIAKTAKSVVKSKITGLVAAGLAAFPLTAPIGVAALGAYAAANAALSGVEAGSQVVSTAKKAASVISQGKKALQAVAKTNARTAAAVQTAGALMPASAKAKIAAHVKAAGTLKLNAKGKAAVASTLARAPAAARGKVASAVASKLKGLAVLKSRAALAKSLPPTASAAVVTATKLQVAASPLIAQARATQSKLAQPAVQKRLVDIRARGVKSEQLLSDVSRRARTGDLDAQKSAAIVNLVARNRARLQGITQVNAGGLPGVLITKDGKLRRGRWRVQAVANAGGVLYTGKGKAAQKGAFQTVSGGPVLIGQLGSTRIIAGPGNPVVLVGRAVSAVGSVLESIAINGRLPEDGIRLSGRGSAAGDLGAYENASDLGHAEDRVETFQVSGPAALIGCGSDGRCAPCAARA